MNRLTRSRSRFKRILSLLLIYSILIIGLSGCRQEKVDQNKPFTDWSAVEAQGQDKTVTILMWGGNDSVNQYMDGFVAPKLKEQYGITLKRVPMNAPEFISKLLNEKKAGLNAGSADLLWINAENFRTARQGNLLWGPFTDLLPNQKTFYDDTSSDLILDTGIAIEGYEAIWGRAQLVLTYDSKRITNVPRTYAQLLAWVKQNPGRFTYPKLPDDFVGTAFVRNAYYEMTGKTTEFQQVMDKTAFDVLSQPVINYFKDLAPYLWHQGQAYPSTQAQLDDMFKNGEVDMTMGFEVGKTAGLVQNGIYPDSVRTFVFDTGTIGNAHYLAIPYNSQEKAAAMLTINFLQSPEAQIEKMKPEVWGDMPALDVSKLDETMTKTLASLEGNPILLSLKELNAHRLPEMQSQYIDWIKEIWVNQIGGK